VAESGEALPAIAVGPRTAAVLRVFLDDPGTPRDGLDIVKAAGLPVHSVYRVLAALEPAGWITAHDAPGGRPRYTMPPAGAAAARRQLPRAAGGEDAGGKVPHVGRHTARVLRLFLDDPHAPRDGWDVMQATGLPDTTVYPVLRRLGLAGWIVSAYVEDPRDGRPPRACYTMPSRSRAEVRRQLGALAAEYEIMRDWRAAGTAWQLIADRLGYESKQAASARYKALAGALEVLNGP
jgi:PadR family transcriptional regulator PadR